MTKFRITVQNAPNPEGTTRRTVEIEAFGFDINHGHLQLYRKEQPSSWVASYPPGEWFGVERMPEDDA